MRPDNNKQNAVLWAAFSVLAAWFGLLCASCAAPGQNLVSFIDALTARLNAPWQISFNRYSLPAVGVALVAYGLCVMMYLDSRKKKRPGEEYGSAKWGNPERLNAKYQYNARKSGKPKMLEAFEEGTSPNIPLTQNVQIGLDPYRHQRNFNLLVIGGSGSKKTRSIAKPNLMQTNSSYIICDPKGELLRDCAPLLLEKNYDIKVFNLKEGERRNGNMYNPFHYLRSDADCVGLVSLLVRATTPKGAHSSDPFWEKAEETLLTALVLYIHYTGDESEKNFAMVMFMLRNAQASEEDENKRSLTDELFNELAEEDEEHIAVQYWQAYKLAAGKTAKSILIMAASRLKHFMIDEIRDMTMKDEMDLASLGERKRAIFVCTPVNDKTFNYMVSMMYMQAFQQLYDRADQKYGGSLPIHVRFLMDEFYNVPPPDAFDNVLSTCRSYNLSCAVILQDINQLKTMYKNEWQSIIAQCDEMIYLGGNDSETHKYVSERLGKETIYTQTTGQTRGSHGSSSKNQQQVGRELLTPSEVSQLNNDYALLFIRGEDPVCDLKYDLNRHPNVKLTADGNAKPYKPQPHIAPASSQIPEESENLYEPEIIGNTTYEYFGLAVKRVAEERVKMQQAETAEPENNQSKQSTAQKADDMNNK